MTLQIKEGRFYRTRDGRKVGPLKKGQSQNQSSYWVGPPNQLDSLASCEWYECGAYFPLGHELCCKETRRRDLIAEWTDEPAPVKEVGTLAEIGAQVGDVVEYTAIGEPHFIARSFTFAGWHDGIPYDIDMKIGGNSNLRTDDECKFRIIRRASDAKPEPQGPVITETVKRIVPGVYGAVGVQDGCLVNVAYMRTAPELRAAIATLTEIADALEGGAK
jgi:hypothetical protein